MAFEIPVFQEVNKANAGTNLTLSPLGVYHILSLTANGAGNDNLKEMLNTLGSEDLEALNNINKEISKIGKFSSIEVANGCFTLFEPEKVFVDSVKKYQAKVEILKDADQVNSWCSGATHKRIATIIDNINKDDLMVLINAIYFKGQWKKEFDAKLTKKRDFLNLGKDKKEADFMNMSEKMDYYDGGDVQAVSLDYKKDNMKAVVILPKEGTDINDFVKSFNNEQYDKIIKGLKNEKVSLSMPKFQVAYEIDLIKDLAALGMKAAFSDKADFSVMKKENDIFIKRVLHRNFIIVDEKGTEAAAATAAIAERNIEVEAIPCMNVNRPFLFIIRSEKLPAEHDIVFIAKIEAL